ncbi:nitronate monooxygenase [Streptomyces sp. NPDC059832]|uniref:nitronate monooxygenase n=1 Tax=Streptomyces sp. NPDC059832 TaxID=3346966 RepID=UPI0036575970
MGGSAGGALAAAVSCGGGLGLLGGGGGERDWLARELPIVAGSGRPWGVGFLSWAAGVGAVEQALEHGPRAVMLSFGDPSPFVERIRAAGAAVIVQVTDLEEARMAVDLGADVIVAQGTESGGHGARRGRATLPFVPVVADLAAPVPVLAAGGIADGRGVAAALVLGRRCAHRHPFPGDGRVPGRSRGRRGDRPRARAGHGTQQRPRHRQGSPLVDDEVHGSHPRPSLPRPLAGKGGGTRRGPTGPTGLSGRCGARRCAAAAGMGR